MGASNGFLGLLRSGKFPISIEITPPRPPLAGRRVLLFRRAGILGSLADAVNAIQRSNRVPSLEAVEELGEAGLEAFWHLANRGRSREEIAADIARAAASGVGLVLCLRGDHGAEDRPDTPTLRECVAMLRRALPHALLGVTAHQHGPRQRVLRNLMPKIEAGAGLVQTQPVFDVDAYTSLARRIKRHAAGVFCMPILMPLTSLEDAEAVRKRVGVPIPDALVAALRRDGPDAGWAHLGRTYRALRRDGLADGVAVMTLRMDPSDEFLQRLRGALGAKPR